MNQTTTNTQNIIRNVGIHLAKNGSVVTTQ